MAYPCTLFLWIYKNLYVPTNFLSPFHIHVHVSSSRRFFLYFCSVKWRKIHSRWKTSQTVTGQINLTGWSIARGLSQKIEARSINRFLVKSEGKSPLFWWVSLERRLPLTSPGLRSTSTAGVRVCLQPPDSPTLPGHPSAPSHPAPPLNDPLTD